MPSGTGQMVSDVTEQAVDARRTAPVWFEMLGVPRTADPMEIERAFEGKRNQFSRATQHLMEDLSFIADGRFEASMPKQLALNGMKAAALAHQLKSMLGTFIEMLEAARDEGLSRRCAGMPD